MTCEALRGLWAQLDETNVMESSCGGRIFGQRKPMETGLKWWPPQEILDKSDIERKKIKHFWLPIAIYPKNLVIFNIFHLNFDGFGTLHKLENPSLIDKLKLDF